MRRLTTIIAMALLLALPVLAQNDKSPRFSPEEFRAKLESFIAQRAFLTQAECEKVFPIYHEMKEKQRELQKKEHQLKYKTLKLEDEDKKFQDVLVQIADLHVEGAKIESTYYKKMSKVISPKKVYGIILAEDAFHREMLQRFNKTQQNKNKRKP